MQTVSGYKMTMVSGVKTFVEGAHTGALLGTLVRNQYTFRGQGADHAAVYEDAVRAEILASVGLGGGAQGETSMAAAIDRTIAEGATGPTHMSRMNRELEKEGAKVTQKHKM